MDEFQFPWKQREILTFDIPVHDSERAGLGVSVKGKTSTSKGESIFLILSNSGNDFLLKTRTQETELLQQFYGVACGERETDFKGVL